MLSCFRGALIAFHTSYKGWKLLFRRELKRRRYPFHTSYKGWKPYFRKSYKQNYQAFHTSYKGWKPRRGCNCLGKGKLLFILPIRDGNLIPRKRCGLAIRPFHTSYKGWKPCSSSSSSHPGISLFILPIRDGNRHITEDRICLCSNFSYFL